MRILAIRGSNLASLAGDFHIDFEAEPLAGSGIFAITGPTGAGKSTLLDAVCLALFAEIPRLRSAPASGSVGTEEAGVSARDSRSILRHGAGEGYAELDFAMPGGGTYRARWSVRRARGKADGRLQGYDHAFERLDTGERMGGTRTETLRAIATLIGLTAEQFTRAVLLAQGDFEAFIRADANDRAALLERLTGSQIYTRLGRAAFEKARALRDGLDVIRQRIAAQHGLDDEGRAEAEAALHSARDEHASAQAALEALQGEARRLLRGRDLAAEVGRAQHVADTALSARDGAHDRREALTKNRAAFALIPLLEARTRAKDALRQSETRLTVAGDALALAEETAALRTQEAREAEQEIALSEAAAQKSTPDLNAARTLDRQLQEADLALTVARESAKTHKTATDIAAKAFAEASEAHEAADIRRRQAADWQQAHASIRALSDREGELEALLTAHANALARRAKTQDERDELAAVETAARSRHAAAREVLETATAAHAAARAARHEAETAVPSSEELASLAARIDAISAAERLSLQAGHAAGEQARTAALLNEIRTRRVEVVTTLGAVVQTLAAAPAAVAALETRLNEARRTLAQSEAASGEAATLLRSGLVDGEPCPVCGAAEHPLSGLETLLGAHLADNRAHVDTLHGELAQALADRRAQTAEQNRLIREDEQLAKHEAQQVKALAAAEAAAAQARCAFAASASAIGLTDPDGAEVSLAPLRDAATAARAAAQNARGKADTARNAEDETRRMLDRAQADDTAVLGSLRASAQALADCDQTLKNLAVQAEGDEAALDRALGATGDWRALPDALAWLRTRAAEWRAVDRTLTEALAALPALDAKRQDAARTWDVALARLSGAEDARQKAAERAAQYREARAALLGGESVRVVEAKLHDATAQARQAQAAITTACNAAGEALASARTLLTTAKEMREADDAALQVARTAFTAALAETALADDAVARVAKAGHTALEAEAEALAALETAVREALAVLTKCRDDLSRHEAQEAAAALPSPEALEAALASAGNTMNAAAARRDDAAALLRQDDLVRERTATLRADLEAANARADVWLRLSDLVGDREGRGFRRFAQGLTLDRLLEHANVRLAELKPRYALERGTGGEMMIQVVDNDMGGQVRGLHNLSGGERFLISLALALGLAEMSTARGVKIESLFIDEGFGALDPASLGQALALLEHLHASGRRVGVISHVEELKERVPVKIDVIPSGRGISRVEVGVG